MAEFKPKILVVDDDPSLLQLMGEVLGQMGAEAHLLESSEKAAELIEKQRYDGFFLDWQMPGMDGLELARRIRLSGSNARAPIVLLTGAADPAVLEAAFHAEVNFFLPKPLSVEQLRTLLNESRGQMTHDRRDYQRAPVEAHTRLRWENRESAGNAVNLSARGALVKLLSAPEPGSAVEVEIELPGLARPIHLRGSVVRVEPGESASGAEVGIRFESYEVESLEKLAQFVARALADEEPDAARAKTL